MVRTALDGHPDIRGHGEEFNDIGRDKYNTKEKVLQRIYGNDPPVHASGFLYHLNLFTTIQPRHPWKSLEQDLRNAKQMKVIHLHRKNMLRQYVSNAIGNHTQLWLRTHSTMPQSTLVVNIRPEKLLWNFETILNLRKESLENFSKHDQIILTYEDVVKNFSTEMRQTQEFLEVTPRELTPRTLQQETRKLKDMIVNYDEIVDLLKDTEYESFID
jgi:hypothetical protein